MLDILPRYTHIVNPKLKHIYLALDSRGELVIKSPKVSTRQIEQVLLNKAGWISRSKERFREKKGKPVDFSESPTLYYKGEVYPLYLIEHEKRRTILQFDGEQFTLYYHTYDEERFQKHIDTFYKEEAKVYVPLLVERWAEKMGLFPCSVHFRKTRRQWGSCSGKNVLNFNTMVMKLPPRVIEYVIVHELAHIRHKHHQKAFWELVAHYLPEYRTLIQALKTYM
jgi:predicted metal-dependent hydrolase